MAQIIRESQGQTIPFGELCLKMSMAPATMYGYMKLMRNVCTDIKYEDGLFSYIGVLKIEELSGQKRLLNL
jgi:hypothetical protein